MLDIILIGIALASGGGGGPSGTAVPEADTAAAAAPSVPGGFEAEDQTPTGKFTTATEVRPILQATQSNWLAVRDYEGQDWIYFTHLLTWRCGLHQVQYAINDEPLRVLELPPCDMGLAQPYAIPTDWVIYETRPAGSVRSMRVEVLYDDLTTESAVFDRSQIAVQ